MDALIGATGFVGGTLRRQRAFDAEFASRTIAGIRGERYDLVICAGAPAAKWIADADPDADIANIRGLADHLDATAARRFVLISTVDVFPDSRGRDEDSAIDEAALTAYGRNRLWLERFVRERFANHLVVRLPGLVGPGLRKNAVFDLHNGNALEKIDARASYQFYPMVNLWADVQAAEAAELRLVHLTGAPITVGEVARQGFGRAFDNRVEGRSPAAYDLHTRHASVFGGSGRYTYGRRESVMAIRAYAQSEPRSAPLA